ncbi:MAG TPA: penicillin acylase family protein, partial [Sphingomonas sp.]|nr:penicillin acylase family protein [Sphingomonas sp.]
MDRPARRLRNHLPLPLALAAALAAAAPAWAQRATIVRDDWGIAHVTGKTDADAVFGAIYAQAEDDFMRIEENYLTALGRMAEAKGEAALWQDLRQRLYVDPAELQAQYRASPPWLRRLMTAWAAGLNHYLATHPDVKPRV